VRERRLHAREVARVSIARRLAHESLEIRHRLGALWTLGQHHAEIEEQIVIARAQTLGVPPRVDCRRAIVSDERRAERVPRVAVRRIGVHGVAQRVRRGAGMTALDLEETQVVPGACGAWVALQQLAERRARFAIASEPHIDDAEIVEYVRILMGRLSRAFEGRGGALEIAGLAQRGAEL